MCDPRGGSWWGALNRTLPGRKAMEVVKTVVIGEREELINKIETRINGAVAYLSES